MQMIATFSRIITLHALLFFSRLRICFSRGRVKQAAKRFLLVLPVARPILVRLNRALRVFDRQALKAHFGKSTNVFGQQKGITSIALHVDDGNVLAGAALELTMAVRYVPNSEAHRLRERQQQRQRQRDEPRRLYVSGWA